MKKIISLILALVMVMGLAVSASAASITITPPDVNGGTENGITYTAYKIFDATINGDAVAYTIESTSPYYTAVNNSGYFTLTKAAGSDTTYIVTAKSTYTEETANTFADTLKAVSASPAGTLAKQTDGTYKVENLSNGYYLVTSSVGSDLILRTIGDVSVTTKNEYPTLEKKVNGAASTTADIGEELTFTIEVQIPEDASGELIIHDKMDGLTNIQNSQVSPSNISDTFNNPADSCSREWKILDAASVAGQTVTVTYTATFTSTNSATNEAWLTYGSYTSNKETVEILTTDLEIWKVDAADNSMLSGAEFMLAKVEDGQTLYYKRVMAGNTQIGVEWVADPEQAEVDPGDISGHFINFTCLKDGTYLLIEKKAPEGYNLLTEPKEIKIEAATAETDNFGRYVEVTVENSSGSELPSTGGMGTTLFYVIGGLMMTCAVVVLVTKRRVA